MPSFTDMIGIISAVRARLGKPSVSKLGNLEILIAAQQQLQHYRTYLKLTNENYFILDVPFSIGANQIDVPLSPPNYKKAICCEWINPAYPNDQGIDVQIVNFTDLDIAGTVARRVPEWWVLSSATMQSIPRAISFRGLPPNMIARAAPQSSITNNLRLYYQPANSLAYDIDGNLQFPAEFINLIQIATALALVPNAWADNQAASNSYSQTLSRELTKIEKSFEWDSLQNKKQQPRASQGYKPPGWGYGGRGY